MRSRTSRSKHQPVLAASGASWRLLLFSVLIGLVLYAKQSSLSTALLRWRHSRPHADDLINWIKSNGGVVNVGVRDAAGLGRYTYALRNLKKGDELAVVPLKLCFKGQPGGEWMTAAAVWQELRDVSKSRLRPYLQTLPARSEVRSYYDLPASYVPLIQNNALENATLALQQYFESWHRGQGGDPTSAEMLQGMTLDDLRYSMSLVKTRLFNSQFGEMMFPLIDMANHHNSCKHTLITHPSCGPGLEDGCVVWKAGSDVPAGEEVCNMYHDNMPQDRAVLQYGFLQADELSHQMSAIDRHDFDAGQPWSFKASLEPFNKTSVQDIEAEADRLTALLLDMKALDATLQLAPDEAMDPDGQMLQLLVRWRQQRQSAIAAELGRLGGMLIAARSAPQPRLDDTDY